MSLKSTNYYQMKWLVSKNGMIKIITNINPLSRQLQVEKELLKIYDEVELIKLDRMLVGTGRRRY